MITTPLARNIKKKTGESKKEKNTKPKNLKNKTTSTSKPVSAKDHAKGVRVHRRGVRAHFPVKKKKKKKGTNRKCNHRDIEWKAKAAT